MDQASLEDFDYFSAFNLPFWVLRKIGMWQTKTSSWSYRFYGFFLHYALMDSLVFSHMIYSVVLLMKGDIKRLADTLSILFTITGMLLKTIWFLIKLQTILKTIETLKELVRVCSFQRSGPRPILKAEVVSVMFVSKAYYISALVSVFFAFLMACMQYKDGVVPYDTYFFFDIRSISAIYWMTSVYQYVMSIYDCMLNYSFDLILVIFMGFVKGLFQELSKEIESIENLEDSGEKSDEDLKKLERCVECHIKIKSMCNEISEHLSFVFFVQAFASSTILCTSVFLLTVVDPVNEAPLLLKTFFYSVTMVFQVFLPCYYGNELSLASAKVSDSLFYSNWVNSSKRFRQATIIFMENTKKPIKITSLGLVTINYETFTSISNSAYSLYAVFQKTGV